MDQLVSNEILCVIAIEFAALDISQSRDRFYPFDCHRAPKLGACFRAFANWRLMAREAKS